jgi:hypothetical protein
MNTMPIFSVNSYKQDILDIKHLEQTHVYTEDDLSSDYNPFRIKHFQNYNPMYTRFLTLSETDYNSFQLNHQYHFVNITTVKDSNTNTLHNKPVFIKYSPLLDPIRYMIGKYVDDIENIHSLPTPHKTGLPKLYDCNNAAYVDSFFYFLSSKTLHAYNFVHGIDFYGSFLGVQDKYKMNVADDIEYLMTSSFFNEHVNKLFSICNYNPGSFFAASSRSNRTKLRISNTNAHNLSTINISDCITTIDEPVDDVDTEVIYENNLHPEIETVHSNSRNTTSSSENSDINYSSTDEDDETNEEDWETDPETDTSDTSSTNDEVQNGYIHNFPVQLICLEHCKGTLDELFVKNRINEHQAASALFQVIMILITYQKMFHFTHNDLHTNNVMYIDTDEPYLYYKYENLCYKVPTYGKIFKLIDFGRSIYEFNGRTMCSDSFGPGGDAATQYNCEPYLDKTKLIIVPNYSFDLCRLGCSIYDFIIPEDEDVSNYDELQKTIHRWCLDDRGKNILYRSNGEERYPNFKLYKMIARTVHQHTPQAQLTYPFFKQFLHKDRLKDVIIMNIDNLPYCA